MNRFFSVLQKSKQIALFCFVSRRRSQGFTFTELVIVISLTLLIVFTIPIGVNFYQTQVLDETAGDVVTTLRRAQIQAIFQKNDSSFGVKFLSDSYVLFQGGSYGEVPGEDESFTLSGGIATSGIDEVVFAKLTGIPDTSGAVTMKLGNNTQVVNINTYGRVER